MYGGGDEPLGFSTEKCHAVTEGDCSKEYIDGDKCEPEAIDTVCFSMMKVRSRERCRQDAAEMRTRW